ncbi:MAG: outer membrane lipoprotein-sorting protein [Crocinitomicaceae bacterium]
MKIVFMIGGLLWACLAYNQTADEIVATYLENIGGAENWAKVKSQKIQASVSVQGMKIPVLMYSFADGKSYSSFTMQGKTMVQQVFDGEKGYEMNFMTQKMEEIDAESLENLKRNKGDFPSPFLNYKEKGYTLEKLEDETVEGVDCFKLKFITGKKLNEGKEVDDVMYYYFDKENYVPIVIETTIKMGPMAGKTSQTVFSDYDEVDGLFFPFSIKEQLKDGDGQGQTITMEKIEINVEEDKSMFDFSAYEKN